MFIPTDLWHASIAECASMLFLELLTERTEAMDASATHTSLPLDGDEPVIDLGDAAELTLGEGKSQKEDKRKLYN